MATVSAIIPTYNRYDYLLNAIESVRAQTYPCKEIIVVDDGSTQAEYKTASLGDDITLITLPKNSREIFGFPCNGYTRTVGMKHATCDYIAFLDDDDVWLPDKIKKQIDAVKSTGCRMSCTEGYAGRGRYSTETVYPLYNSEYYWKSIEDIYRRAGHRALLGDKMFPSAWTSEFINIHNCCVTSSVLAERSLLEDIGFMDNVRIGQEDWGCWKKVLRHTDCVYVTDPCFYYDLGHGHGQNY
jgi:glycosyltransferase involved in cell wall biosynthesis